MNLYGASGHCKVVIDAINSHDGADTIQAVFDDNPTSNYIANVPVVKVTSEAFIQKLNIVISIGNNAVRKRIAEAIAANYKTIIHSKAIVAKSAKINAGTVVFAGAIINAEASVGEHCIVNSGAIVEHDCSIGNYAHISPNAALGGNVSIGEGTHIGIGASVIQGVTIGKWAIVGAGAVVIKDVPDFATVVGNPAKVIKYTDQKK